MNNSIIAMSMTLEKTEQKSWKDHVQSLVYAYNYTKHFTTGYVPYFILLLSVGLILDPTKKTAQKTHSKFVNDWRNQMSPAYKIASTNSSCRKCKYIARHDSSIGKK